MINVQYQIAMVWIQFHIYIGWYVPKWMHSLERIIMHCLYDSAKVQFLNITMSNECTENADYRISEKAVLQ